MENFSKKLIQYCINKGLSISVAESCTGGMIVSKLISIPGASKVIDCGLVTYSNKAKQIYLDVPEFELEKYGAVSKQVAESMINGQALVEPALGTLMPDAYFQFERVGFFKQDSESKDDRIIYNRSVTLKDAWTKKK